MVPFRCETCYSGNVSLYCNQGFWNPTYPGDPNSIEMNYICNDCNHRGKITMVGDPAKSWMMGP